VIDSQLYYAGTFDPESIQVMRALVHSGDTVVDVGANIGWFTLHLAEQVGSTGSVLALEPVPPTVSRPEGR
jgi:predicted methyltransferase